MAEDKTPEIKFVDKRVDESWKEQAEREKKIVPPRPAPAPKAHQPLAGAPASPTPSPADTPIPPDADADLESGEMNFGVFISSLGMQALMQLGEIENPMTGQRELDPEHAKQTIEILRILKEKTKGNLSAQENQMLDQMLYEIQMRFVAVMRSLASTPPQDGGAAFMPGKPR